MSNKAYRYTTTTMFAAMIFLGVYGLYDARDSIPTEMVTMEIIFIWALTLFLGLLIGTLIGHIRYERLAKSVRFDG
jgi:hypothetical protein